MRKLMLSLFLLGLLAVGLMPAAAAPSKAAAPTKTIAAIVAEQAANKKTPQFTTLLAALKAASLVETLSGQQERLRLVLVRLVSCRYHQLAHF